MRGKDYYMNWFSRLEFAFYNYETSVPVNLKYKTISTMKWKRKIKKCYWFFIYWIDIFAEKKNT